MEDYLSTTHREKKEEGKLIPPEGKEFGGKKKRLTPLSFKKEEGGEKKMVSLFGGDKMRSPVLFWGRKNGQSL